MTIHDVVEKGGDTPSAPIEASAPPSDWDAQPTADPPATHYDEVPFAEALSMPAPPPDVSATTDPVTESTPVATATVLSNTSPIVYPPGNTPAPPPTGQGKPIPVGARWITIKHIGGVTWTICGVVSTIFCCLMCCPCGVWAFLCPCDEIRGYVLDGQVFDEHGRPLGSIDRLRVVGH